ncbi:MAG: T9SS type A sorting domain-containing protein, partial [Flavobacteriales bacterium]|nr:T9SS type A sorting domain-containing protein [Flavobacteriales bacterium]
QQQKSWTITPNPASNFININPTKNKLGSLFKITVFDLNGKPLTTKTFNLSENQLDISMLKPGFYSILINSINDTDFSRNKLLIIR